MTNRVIRIQKREPIPCPTTTVRTTTAPASARKLNLAQGPLAEWQSLNRFLEDGDIPLDNNRTEHALRQQVLGRVNWLFVGSNRGGETAAVLYSLVATCKRLRIDPFAYLRDVFARLPEITTDEQLRDLLPDRWSDRHPEHRLMHRDKQASQANQRRRQRRARRRELRQTHAK